jgi:shikimate 5-dehydrogenase
MLGQRAVAGAGRGGCAVCYAALRMGAKRNFIFDQDYGRAERLSRKFAL